MSRALRVGVPLNRRCSRKCVEPYVWGSSSREPTATQYPTVELRDLTTVQPMRVREVNDDTERARLWKLAVAAFPPYEEYQAKTTRRIPVFIAEPRG